MTAPLRPCVIPQRLFAAASALAMACALATGPIAAQTSKPTLDDVRQRDQELESLRAEQKKAVDAQKKLQDEIDAISEDRRKLNQALIATAADIRSVETRTAAAEGQLGQLTESETGIRKALDARRGVIVEVLAALQRIGRRPPPAMLVKPEDALESVRGAMLLGAVVPEMRTEAQSLAGELSDLVRVRGEAAAEREGLGRDLATLATQKMRMSMLIDQRQKRQSEAEKELDGQRQHAVALSRQAETLKELIGKLESELDAPTRAQRAADTSRALGDTRADLSALKDPGRLSPALAF